MSGVLTLNVPRVSGIPIIGPVYFDDLGINATAAS